MRQSSLGITLLDPYFADEGTGIRLRPEHVQLALHELAGIEAHDFSKQFPLTVPDAVRLSDLRG